MVTKREKFAAIKKEAEQSEPLLKDIKPVTFTYYIDTEELAIAGKRKKIDDLEELFVLLVQKSITPQRDVDIDEIVPQDSLPQLKAGMAIEEDFQFIITGIRDNERLSEVYTVPIRLKVGELRGAAHASYFQGVLQLRSVSADIANEAIDLLKKYTTIAKRVPIAEDGLDVYVTHKKPLLRTAEYLQQQYGGKIHRTATLHTRDRQTQKDLYRETVLFCKFTVAPGDVIEDEDTVLKVNKVGRKITATVIGGPGIRTYEDDATFSKPQWHAAQVVGSTQVYDEKTMQTVDVDVCLESLDNTHQAEVAYTKKGLVIARPKK